MNPAEYQRLAQELLNYIALNSSKPTKVMVIIETEDDSVVEFSEPKDFTVALGLLRLTEFRILEKEREMFSKRQKVQEIIENNIQKQVQDLSKESMN